MTAAEDRCKVQAGAALQKLRQANLSRCPAPNRLTLPPRSSNQMRNLFTMTQARADLIVNKL
jgi:hypothetical protein